MHAPTRLAAMQVVWSPRRQPRHKARPPFALRALVGPPCLLLGLCSAGLALLASSEAQLGQVLSRHQVPALHTSVCVSPAACLHPALEPPSQQHHPSAHTSVPLPLHSEKRLALDRLIRPRAGHRSMRHSRYVFASLRQPSAWLAFSFRHAKYCSFTCTRRAQGVFMFCRARGAKGANGARLPLLVWARTALHSPKWSRGKTPLSGGFGW